MGNTPSVSSEIRRAIVENDYARLQTLVGDPAAGAYINCPVNRKGDSPLILASRLQRCEMMRLLLNSGADVTVENREHDTALDAALEPILPHDGDILHQHICPFSHLEHKRFQLPENVLLLLQHNARGKSLDRLVLHHAKDPDAIHQIIEIISNIAHPEVFRLCGLLLQVSVWFEQQDNLFYLFERGVNIENFWIANFMPKIQPSNYYRSVEWPRGEAAEYQLASIPDCDGIQSLKLSFVQDWRADWNDGENPAAQYRASLHLTPDCALTFACAANRYTILVRVMYDVMGYLPLACSGPDLGQTSLILCLTMAGYLFSEDEQRHLQLKFNVDFKSYHEFVSQPKPLKQLCRLTARFSFNENVFRALSKLTNLPELIKDYLLLQDCL